MDNIDFFFNDTATTEIYTLSLHDALPIYDEVGRPAVEGLGQRGGVVSVAVQGAGAGGRVPGDAAGERRHLVAAVEGRRRHVPAEEVGAAEDEKSHAVSPAQPLPRRPAGSPWAQAPRPPGCRTGRPAPAAAAWTGRRPAPSAASAAGRGGCPAPAPRVP